MRSQHAYRPDSKITMNGDSDSLTRLYIRCKQSDPVWKERYWIWWRGDQAYMKAQERPFAGDRAEPGGLRSVPMRLYNAKYLELANRRLVRDQYCQGTYFPSSARSNLAVGVTLYDRNEDYWWYTVESTRWHCWTGEVHWQMVEAGWARGQGAM